MKKTKVIIGLGLALCAAVALGACAAADREDELIREGYNVVVSYELNGGLFGTDASSSSGGTEGEDAFNIVHYYRGEELAGGIGLLEPGDKQLESSGTVLSAVARGGYFQIGWYRSMEPRINKAGEALDENGELCSETGKPQGHFFSGKWDFSKDRLKETDFPDGPDEKGAYRLTLYAAWAPNYVYEFYREKTDAELADEKQKYEEEQQDQIADGTLKPEDAKPFVEEKWLMYQSVNRPADGSPIAIPALDPETGAWKYGAVPQYAGHTIEKIYADSALTEEYTAPIPHEGQVDEEHGTAEKMIVRCYTTWRDGVWYEIRTADQFYDNFEPAGHYVIQDDLDFTGLKWSGCAVTFTGSIEGNGHTFSNLKGEQSSTSAPLHAGGVFGVIASGASIRDVHFEDVVFDLYYCDYLHATSGASYGLFAGEIAAGATVEGVTLSGTINLGMLTNRFDTEGEGYFANFAVGLVSGNAENMGISYENCHVGYLAVDVIVEGEEGSSQIKGYPVKATVGAEGILAIVRNDDKTKKPE